MKTFKITTVSLVEAGDRIEAAKKLGLSVDTFKYCKSVKFEDVSSPDWLKPKMYRGEQEEGITEDED